MINALELLFAGVLLAMLALTVAASLDGSVVEAGRRLMLDPWGRATLADCYFGFLTFYLWVAYKQPGLGARALWFVLVMTLGNIAMASYLLWQLSRLPAGAGVEDLLLRRPFPEPRT